VQTDSGGNSGLQPETAVTTTLGAVFRVGTQFSVAIDMFDIAVSDAIVFVGGNGANTQNACLANPASRYCTLIVRNSGGLVTTWKQTYLNYSKQQTQGIDVEANWSTALFGRALNVRGFATYQPHFNYIQEGLITTEVAGVAVAAGLSAVGAQLRASAYVNYHLADHWEMSWLQRWRSSMRRSDNPGLSVAAPDVPSVGYSNLTLTYSPALGARRTELSLTVQNLFDQPPPPSAFSGSANAPGIFGGAAAGDDQLGRYFTLGLRYRP
jgi:outer membrane receptor protein involved in Fe transport